MNKLVSQRIGFALVFSLVNFFITVSVSAQINNQELSFVDLSPSDLEIALNQDIFMSALAYDTNGQPIYEGVTYDWGISSINSFSTFKNIQSNTATFVSFDHGVGDLWVTAFKGGQSVTKSVRVRAGNAIFDVPIDSVEINLNQINTTLNQPVYLSALAYDADKRPLYEGVSYDWGMSSSGSLGWVDGYHNVVTFRPLGTGQGDLWVTARNFAGEAITKSIRVTVTQPAVMAADINQDQIVDLTDYSLLALNFLKTGININPPRTDITGDGIVDLTDYSLLSISFLQTY